jgi:hypothetical protein
MGDSIMSGYIQVERIGTERATYTRTEVIDILCEYDAVRVSVYPAMSDVELADELAAAIDDDDEIRDIVTRHIGRCGVCDDEWNVTAKPLS